MPNVGEKPNGRGDLSAALQRKEGKALTWSTKRTPFLLALSLEKTSTSQAIEEDTEKKVPCF